MTMNKWLPSRLQSALPYALIGAVTCAIAILVAEIFVQIMQPRSLGHTNDTLTIAMLVDVSGSMEGEPIQEVKEASIRFLHTWDRTDTAIILVPFSSDAQHLKPTLQPGQDPQPLVSQIQELAAHGGTAMGLALELANTAFENNGSNRNAVMLFTDGMASDAMRSRRQAESLRQQGVVITAIGTADADLGFLERLVGGDASRVFTTRLGNFADAFDEAARTIVASSFGTARTAQGLVVVAVVALFLAAAFLVAENILGMRGNWWRDIWWVPPLGLMLGFLGGAIGESLFQAVVIAWALVGLGCGAALGLTDMAGDKTEATGIWERIPGKARRGALFGLVGGIVGGLIFNWILGDANLASSRGAVVALLSRMGGFSLLGFFVGLAIRIGEELLKDAWLMGTVKGPYEGKQYILDKPVVSVGKSGNNDINLHREDSLRDTSGHFLQVQGDWFFQPGDDNAAAAVAIHDRPVLDRTLLHDSTPIRFGNTEFVFRHRKDPGKVARESRWALIGDEEVFPLPRDGTIKIGNAPTCDIVLREDSVAPWHGTLEFTDKGLELRPEADCEVSVNDEKLSRQAARVLQQGDLIALGSVELAFVEDLDGNTAQDDT